MMKDRKQVWILNVCDSEGQEIVSGVYDDKGVAERVAAHEKKQTPWQNYRIVESTLWMWEEGALSV